VVYLAGSAAGAAAGVAFARFADGL
jgi:hypothetical protein